MTNTDKRIDQVFVKIDGIDLRPPMMALLYDVEVESSLYLPSMCTLRFYDDDFELIDDTLISLGKKIEVAMAPWDAPEPKVLFKGEVTALEPEFNEDSVCLFVVRAYDARHRLNHRHTNTFLKMTDSDIVKKIVREAGIAMGKIDATGAARDHIFQDNQTDLAFIQMLALHNGFEVSVNDEKFDFCTPKPTAPIDLKWRENLFSFRPRVTLAEQVKETQVRTWDRAQKKVLVSTQSVQSKIAKVGIAGEVKNAPNFAASKYTEGRIPRITQRQMESLAKSLAQDIGTSYAEAEGTALGDGKLMPGISVKIGNVGTRFGGVYTLTSTRHSYTSMGYQTHFTIEGTRPQQVSDLTGGSCQRAAAWQGVVIGIVTDNKDPEKMNRVKVKLPTLTEDLASTWAPVASVGAGPNRGIQWMPEVNDEVLIAFEFGNINSPFVIGSLWNGKDKTPETTPVESSGTVLRTMKTRVGHTIRMIDADSGAHKKGIEIVDGSGKFTIVINATTGEILISSGGKITVKATSQLALTGTNVSVKATGPLEMTGATVSVKATGMLELQASGVASLKGSMVNINS